MKIANFCALQRPRQDCRGSESARETMFERPQTPRRPMIGDFDRGATADGEANDSLLFRVRSGEGGNQRAVLRNQPAERFARRLDEAMNDDAVEAPARTMEFEPVPPEDLDVGKSESPSSRGSFDGQGLKALEGEHLFRKQCEQAVQ